MKKNVVKLNEAQLCKIVENSVKKILKEWHPMDPFGGDEMMAKSYPNQDIGRAWVNKYQQQQQPAQQNNANQVQEEVNEGLFDMFKKNQKPAYNYAESEYEKERQAKLDKQAKQAEWEMQQQQRTARNNAEIASRENAKRNKGYHDPMGGYTGKSEKEYYGNDYGYVRNGSNNDDWKYGRR